MTLVVVTGVGTDVGKTHTAAALLHAWGALDPVTGYKPIETGVSCPPGPDEGLLEPLSTFHVKRPLLHARLRSPVSPHLASREEGVALNLPAFADEAAWLRVQTHVVMELPGGLFSPLSDTECNADLLALLKPDVVLLVAVNRLGVLHDVRAVSEACRARGLSLDGVVLNASAQIDASVASNGKELATTCGLPILAELPRASVAELVASGALDGLVRRCRMGRSKASSLE